MSVAFIFPGQGSQSIGMLASFAEKNIIKNTFQEASDALGYDLWSLCQEGPEEQLNQTDKTQPALLTASVALWRLWQESSQTAPSYLAGHSLGEYSALTCAGALTLSEAVTLVAARGEFMQQAVPTGTGKMAAIIGLDDEAIVAACHEAQEQEVVAPVNYNSPGQVVIAGNAAAVERAMVLCKEKGAKRALPLPVSVPSHCALMEPAAEKLAEKLNTVQWSEPNLPVINNVDVAVETDPESIKKALVRQLHNPVRWTETVLALKEKGVTQLVECGAGNVLTGLTKRISRDFISFNLSDESKFGAAVNELV